MQGDAKEKFDKLTLKARVTKASGCLLAALGSTTDFRRVRSAVLSELKELRGFVGKEMERGCLHPFLKERVQVVLKAGK